MVLIYFFSITHDQAATVVQIEDAIICLGTEQEEMINGKSIFCTYSIFKFDTSTVFVSPPPVYMSTVFVLTELKTQTTWISLCALF